RGISSQRPRCSSLFPRCEHAKFAESDSNDNSQSETEESGGLSWEKRSKIPHSAWAADSSYTSPMTDNKTPFCSSLKPYRRRIQVGGGYIYSDGIGTAMVKLKDGNYFFLANTLFVPGLGCTLRQWEKKGVSNGPAERSIQTTEKSIRCMLDDAKLPVEFWCEEAQAQAYTRARMRCELMIVKEIVENLRKKPKSEGSYNVLPVRNKRGRSSDKKGIESAIDPAVTIGAGHSENMTLMIPSTPDKKPLSNPLGQILIADKNENNMTNHKITTVTLDPIANEKISNEIPKLITSENISNKNLDTSGIEEVSSKVENSSDEENTSNKFQEFTVENNNTNNHDVFSNSSQEKSSVTGLPHFDDVPSRNESNQEGLETGEIPESGIKKAVNFDDLVKMIPRGSLRSGTKRQIEDDESDEHDSKRVKVILALLNWFEDVDSTGDENETAMIINDIDHDIPIPKTFMDAISDAKYGKQWREAIDIEIQQLIGNGTWHEEVAPQNANLVTSKWGFSLKFNADGTLERFKARLVARGFSQQYGVDYTETFAPTVRMATLRTFLALVACEDLECYHYDIKNAFTESILNEEISMKISREIERTKPGTALRLLKSLFGRSVPLYTCVKNIRLLVYVDDLAAAAPGVGELEWFFGKLSARFNAKNLGELNKTLGVRVTRNRSERSIELDQELYLVKILTKFGFPVPAHREIMIPMENYKDLRKATADDKRIDATWYREVIGSLMYAIIYKCKVLADSLFWTRV
ncbi:hypothetical protein EPUL_004806, partial [Erysiphe pulchra]